jgi:hypothetical protein
MMNDLSKQEYEILKPIDHPEELRFLWICFQKLVKTVLIHLGDLDIVHQDIHPGMTSPPTFSAR